MFNALFIFSLLLATGYALVDDVIPETALAIKRGFSAYGRPIASDADNFTELIRNSKVFLDNSNIIDEIIERHNHPNYVTIVGPDNWGKSITMDFIKSFFELKFDENGKKIPRTETDAYRLFVKQEIIHPDGLVEKLKRPLLISDNSLHMRFQGAHPVIHVSFKDCVGDNATEIKEKMYAAVKRAFEPFKFVPPMLKFYHVRDSLKYLCEGIRDHMKELHMVVILIEDYDTPIVNFLQNDLYPKEDMFEIYRFLKDLIPFTFHMRDNDDCCLFRGIVTSRFNFEYHEYDEEFFVVNKSKTLDEYFGFSHAVVTKLFRKMKMDEKLAQKAFAWYGGYESFLSNQSFYNPFAIASFAKRRKLDLYSKTYEDYEFLQHLFKRYPPILNAIVSLISKQTVQVEDKLTLEFEYKPRLRNALVFPTKANSLPKTFDVVKLFTYFLQDGVLVKIPDSNQAKLINIEMTFLMAKQVIRHYMRKYRIHECFMRNVTVFLQDFISGSVSSTEDLQTSMSELYNSSLSKMTKFDEAIRSIFTCILLQTQVSSKFDIDAYYDKIRQAEFVAINNELGTGVIIQVNYNSTAQNAVQLAKQHENILKSFANLKRTTLLGINVKPNHMVEIMAETKSEK